ncbi:MAG: type I-C CRISPR-associated protein Cas8c/Csd1, partial [Rhodospirillaceae bacterium]|nr:type I-C CRISPR-associated protein Cas8c/Csd1 [Rhodospirillaceae bacterium]
VMRLRADGTVSDLRAALLKACLRRAERLSNSDSAEDGLVSLDRASDDVAYNLGRLFAAYVYAEKSYTMRAAAARDMRLGAAAASPRRVFPVLMRGHEYNRISLARGNRRQRAFGVRAERMVAEILDRLPDQKEWPSFLPLDNQARFFVGYYHQERALYTRSDAGRERAGDSGGQR